MLKGYLGFPGGSDDKISGCNAEDDPWVAMIPWKREWQPTTVFLPGEFQTEEPGGLQFMRLQIAGHD